MTRLPRALTFISVFIAGVQCADGFAQQYPARTVRVIVTYAPGGGSDILGRMISAKAGEELGQQFVIDNRPGGSATIGTQMIARATPDGYTIGVIDTALTMNPGLFTKLPYDSARDFAPVTLIASSPLMLCVHPSMPVKSVKELIALAKSHPGQLTFGSAGAGTALHLAQELFKVVTGIDAIHVPYKGGGPAVTALVSGEVGMSFLTPAAIGPFVQAGKVRTLAITGEKRYAGFPELPTLIESGIRGAEAEPWWGFVAPAGTPATIVARLNEIFVKQINAPEMRQRLVDAAFVPVANTPEEFAAFLRTDTIKLGKSDQGRGNSSAVTGK